MSTYGDQRQQKIVEVPFAGAFPKDTSELDALKRAGWREVDSDTIVEGTDADGYTVGYVRVVLER